MGILSILKQVGIATIRLPLRGIDWVKTKLGYVSVPTHREFVYLDETSVISLIASTTGGITEQKSTVKRRQISGSIKGGLGDKSSSLGANVGATKERETQATRRYVIQSNFKELYDMRADDMIIADEYDETESVPRKIWNALTPSSSRIPIHETEVNRGDLAEINVDLGSHKVYNFYTAVGSIAEIYDVFPDDSQFVDELESEEFSIEILNAFSELVEHLLAGLVPIVGEVKNYGVVVEDDTPKIISKEYASKNDIEYDQLNIVGFVNSGKFWQEETRFLFEDDEYSVYCRLDNDEVMDEWMPIKLASVISSIDSDLGDSVHDLPEAFEISDTNAERERQDQIKLRPRLEKFIGDLQDKTSLDIEQSSVDNVVEATLEETGKTTTRIEAIEEALKQLEQELDSRGYDYEISLSERGDIVDEILSDNFEDLNQGDEEDEWYLGVSFTAIYW